VVSDPPSAPETPTRAARWAARRGRSRRIALITGALVVVAGVATGTIVALSDASTGTVAPGDGKLAAAHPTTIATVATTTTMPTTTTTIPPVRQPAVVTLPPLPANGISWGSSGPITLAYEQRLKALHFDPGPVDGTFSQDTSYAVTAVEKLFGLPRDGIIGPVVKVALEHFKYAPAKPKAEGDRVEINLDTQVLTVYKHWQPILLTTTSTGSGVHFCGGVDGCQYAITPTGKFHFYYWHQGWDNGKLGKMWNPYYFNGGIAVHGLASVPSYPASHGCARIPLDIANYFPQLVTKGEAVYVVGTPMKPGSGYVGPAPTTTSTSSTSTTVPKSTTTKPHATTTTVHHPTTTTKPHATTTSSTPTTTASSTT
jgi:peptidoglycan hydrolase-like protein with peptidoglycan-binding domain